MKCFEYIQQPAEEVWRGHLQRRASRHFPGTRPTRFSKRPWRRAPLAGKSVLFIIPDSTRSFPSNFVFTTIHELLSGKVRKLDFLIALGTHRPMSDKAIRAMLGLSESEMKGRYSDARVFNHVWDDPAALRHGSIGKERIAS